MADTLNNIEGIISSTQLYERKTVVEGDEFLDRENFEVDQENTMLITPSSATTSTPASTAESF